MNRTALADRMITYSDTIVAFSLVNGFAFLTTLGEPDIRCSIANVAPVALTMNVLFPVVGTYGLFWLRRYERLLRSDGSEEGGEDDDLSTDPIVSRFWHVLFRVRLGLIWIFAALVIFGIVGATQDEQCALVKTGLG